MESGGLLPESVLGSVADFSKLFTSADVTHVSLQQLELWKQHPFSTLFFGSSHSQAVTASLNNSSSILWQYILFYKQWTNVREDTHAIVSPYLIYQNNRIQNMKQTVHKYIPTVITHKTQNAWRPFIRCIDYIFLNQEPQAILI